MLCRALTLRKNDTRRCSLRCLLTSSQERILICLHAGFVVCFPSGDRVITLRLLHVLRVDHSSVLHLNAVRCGVNGNQVGVDELGFHAHLLSLPCKILLILDGSRQVIEEYVSITGSESKGIHWVVDGKPFNQSARNPYLKSNFQLISLTLLAKIDQIKDAL